MEITFLVRTNFGIIPMPMICTGSDYTITISCCESVTLCAVPNVYDAVVRATAYLIGRGWQVTGTAR